MSDGGGLYYQPTAPNKGKWSYRFAMDGKSHEMGLGTFPEISLKEARLAHAEQREAVCKRQQSYRGKAANREKPEGHTSKKNFRMWLKW